uniref:Uncharacterized protein n=1 Tax=Oryza brachyantha TaxID=4533 RepID=J3MSX8_ORYBR
MRRTRAVSMNSGSSRSTIEAADAAPAAHRPPRIGRTPSAIPVLAADRYTLEVCDSRARSGMSVSCRRAGRPLNSEMRSSVPSVSSANTTSSSTSVASLVAVAFTLAFALSPATTGCFLLDLAGLAPASTVELDGFFALAADSDFAVFTGFTALVLPAFATFAGFPVSVPFDFAVAALSTFGTLAFATAPSAGAFVPAAADFLVAFTAPSDSDFLTFTALVWFLASTPTFFLIFPAAATPFAFLAGVGTSSPSSARSAFRPPAAFPLGFPAAGAADEQSAMWERRSTATSSSISSAGLGLGGAISVLQQTNTSQDPACGLV